MRHRVHKKKFNRTSEHRQSMLANLVCSLIKHKRITTTLAKAKAARPVAEKLVTIAKGGTAHDRRIASARLRQHPRRFFEKTKTVTRVEARDHWKENEDVIGMLFDKIAPQFKERHGGYTRIIKIGQRNGDAAKQAILEWVDDSAVVADEKKEVSKPADK
ncbi:MAG: 50S ribosomal protein L17 [Pedosphaera sp.]|nr:50S ribosomal protein L17 [Pedosphaera sp.]